MNKPLNKPMKYALYAVGTLILLFVLGLAGIAIFVNPDDYKPQISEIVKENTGRTLTFGGKIGLKLFPRIALDLGETRLSGPGGVGEFASVGHAKLDVAWLPLLHGKMQVDRIEIDGMHVDLQRGKDGKSNFDDLAKGNGAKGEAATTPPGAVSSGRGAGEFDIGGIDIRNSSVSYQDLKAGSRIAIDGIALKTGRLKYGEHTSFTLGFDADSGSGKMRLDVASGLLMKPGSFSLDGMDLKFSRGKISLESKGNATIDTAEKKVSLGLATAIDDSHVKSKVDVTGFSKPAIHFDVRVDKLDLDKYLQNQKAGSSAGTSVPGASTPAASAPEKPFDLSFLKNLDLNGKLAIDSLVVHRLKLSSLSTQVLAKDGKLVLSPFAANLYQGKTSGSITVDARKDLPSFAVRDELAGISVAPLLRDLTGKDMLEGKGNVSLDVNATGNLPGKLKRSLGGKAALRFTDGAIRGIDIAAMLRKLKSGLSGGGAANSSEKTDFSDLSASFLIRQGVAHNSDLDMKSPLLRLGGEGDIDIGASSMNYLARISVVATLEGQGGADLSSLKGITIPLRISGPFDSLKFTPDAAALARGLVKSKIEQKLPGGAGGLLKGLFGR
ncbi:MAG: AsmA family protein [Burkholderiales bacterium]|nr:AsmA family protein [Burkholderiales bacterium]